MNLTVKIEVLYAPTCANSLMWLERIREVMADFDDKITIEEIDVSEHPNVLKKYPSRVWQEFLDGYIHYVTKTIRGRIPTKVFQQSRNLPLFLLFTFRKKNMLLPRQQFCQKYRLNAIGTD